MAMRSISGSSPAQGEACAQIFGAATAHYHSAAQAPISSTSSVASGTRSSTVA